MAASWHSEYGYPQKTSITFTFPAGLTNPMMLVIMHARGVAHANPWATYNGVALTNSTGVTASRNIHAFHMTNPPEGSAYALATSLPGSVPSKIGFEIIVLEGANPADPIGDIEYEEKAGATSFSHTLDDGLDIGDLAVQFIHVATRVTTEPSGNVVPGAGQTEEYEWNSDQGNSDDDPTFEAEGNWEDIDESEETLSVTWSHSRGCAALTMQIIQGDVMVAPEEAVGVGRAFIGAIDDGNITLTPARMEGEGIMDIELVTEEPALYGQLFIEVGRDFTEA